MTDGLLYALLYVFILTFICYPGLALNDTITFMEDWNNYNSWHVLFIQGIFNLCDSIGRYCGGVTCLILKNPTIKISALVRTLFVITFLLISFDVAPKLFPTDGFIIFNLVLFSLSNGYVSTLCAVKAPNTV